MRAGSTIRGDEGGYPEEKRVVRGEKRVVRGEATRKRGVREGGDARGGGAPEFQKSLQCSTGGM